ncbi:hypothetical protein K493DRAFT_348935 [Basidiobolus meristosporus CBS 931.73]|uniref:NmrA-like domain-containing protein n=1 Tax=Basidiobolus meristosporus CBS 931.73 TaxID=1314790 RepID=A0A1Y1YLK9_9FUNG|nr:hypothetical protein K493DRAFT_348935 [Basidiobolus meristosporus CBS 931.73]|eukprot:ORX98897.1 hypothetical protein K493DRAFT_348935 [Basidiobolus meristosporus CBS 931.73]
MQATTLSSKFDVSGFSRVVGKKVDIPGVRIVEGDLDDYGFLEKALTGVDIVISSFSGPGMPSQSQILSAAKQAGVRRFAPSDFGYHFSLDIKGYGKPYVHPFIETKLAIEQEIKDLELEYTIVHNGRFIDAHPETVKKWGCVRSDEFLVVRAHQSTTLINSADITIVSSDIHIRH